MGSKWNMSQQYALVAMNANCALGFFNKSITSRSRETVVSFCLPLMRRRRDG